MKGSQYLIESRSNMFKPAFLTQSSTVASEPPAWLDLKELQDLLVQEFPTFQQIESIRCRTEQNSLRLQIQANLPGTVNYLVKSEDLSCVGNSKFPRSQNFQLEQHMYNSVLPALEELFQDVGQKIAFAPSSYTIKRSNCLYLEDLQAKGFRLANQPRGLDPGAMQVALSKLAAYHAASARYLQLKPDVLKEISKLNSNRKPAHDKEDLKNWLQRKFHESLRANDLREFEDKVKYFQKYLASYVETSDPKKSFNVILNGACWSSNLLGQFDAFGQLKDVVFYDFGGAAYGPAIHDLLELLLTAPAAKTEQFDAYLRYYRNELTANLRLLQFKGKLPSLTDFQLDLLNYGHWAFEIITEILPIVLADFDCEDIEEIFKLSKYSAEIRKLLPWLENRGYFEAE